jgi:3-oxoadipate enol-lactonase
MGGGIALKATIEAPQRVPALVLLDAVVDGVAWDERSEAGMRAIGQGLRSGGVSGAKAAWLEHDFFTPAGRSPELAARLATMVADYSGAHWTRPDPHGPGPAVLAGLPSISVPTTVVVGELDVPCFRSMADILASTIPGARLVVVPDAGHMVNMEAPTVVNSILIGVVDAASRA